MCTKVVISWVRHSCCHSIGEMKEITHNGNVGLFYIYCAKRCFVGDFLAWQMVSHWTQISPSISNVELQVSTAMCVLCRQVISDYVTPPCKELSRDLDATIKPHIRYCRCLECLWWPHTKNHSGQVEMTHIHRFSLVNYRWPTYTDSHWSSRYDPHTQIIIGLVVMTHIHRLSLVK